MLLKRSISLPMLIFYGVGTMVGGGFYALVGKVAGEAGMHAPYAILAATIIALFSAFSFAELCARFPYSAGESHYIKEAFGWQWLATLTGWLVVATGVVSAATLATAIVGFIQDFASIPITAGIILVVIGMGAIALWGISESLIIAAIITVIEVGGLLLIIFLRSDSVLSIAEHSLALLPPIDALGWLGTINGGFLIFYAFLGFEDMVNIAEEVKDVRKSMPIAIISSLLITAVLYILVVLVSVLSTPISVLASSNTPLAAVLQGYGPTAMKSIGIISLFAGLNGALVQIIMASRVIYGMAGSGSAPKVFASVSPLTHTPIQATVTVTLIVLLLALFFPLVSLAKATSTIILCVFALVNGSLWWLKRNPLPAVDGAPTYSRWLPAIGFILCSLAVAYRVWTLIQ